MIPEYDGRPDERPPGVPALFALMWNEVADIISTAATAALVRRAAKRAAPRHPMLAQLTVGRTGFTPEYSLPPGWEQDPTGPATNAEFAALAAEFVVLLKELTGVVVLRRLAQLPLPLDQLKDLREGHRR